MTKVLIDKFTNDVAKRSRLMRFLLVLDQMLNVILWNGSQDETVSSHISRRIENGEATLALMLRGMFWWGLVYFTLAMFGIISYEVAMMISLLLGMAFPIACEIGKRITFTKEYDLKFIKLSFSPGWENQEAAYGLLHGIVLCYVVFNIVFYN